jgi:hypothetical protein
LQVRPEPAFLALPSRAGSWLVLRANIILGGKGSPGANSLTYLALSSSTKKKVLSYRHLVDSLDRLVADGLDHLVAAVVLNFRSLD